MLHIPARFERLVREIVAERVLAARAQFALLARIHGHEHPDTRRARLVLDEAVGLSESIASQEDIAA